MIKSCFLPALLFFTCEIFSQNYTILGNASSLGGCNCFRLTYDANDQGGAIYQNQTINLNNSFDFTFSVFLGCRNGNDAADGIVFVLTSNPNGLGLAGEYLGYGNGSNQPFSLAVEFDTWQNGNHGDPGYDHIAIEAFGSVDHTVAAPVPALPGGGNIDNCQWYTVRIVWDVNTGTFSVYFNGTLMRQIVNQYLVDNFFGGNPIVNWGWSGATGGGTNDQQVCVNSVSNWMAGVNYQSCDLTLQFSDISTSNLGSVQSWAWTFGDGGVSSLQNPSHTFQAAGTYSVTLLITDLSGCTNTFTHDVTINPPITLTDTLIEPGCNGGSDGNILIGTAGGFGASAGYGGYTYTWNGGARYTESYEGIPAGTYSVFVTDGVCSATAAYTLGQPTPITAVTTHTDATCGMNDGSVSITLSGGTPPYTSVSWGSGLVGNIVNGLGQGVYVADFHDFNGCSALLTYREIINPLPCNIRATTSSTNVSCFGDSNGTATLTVTGGAAPDTITWSNGATGSTITGLPAGTYTYTYRDAVPANMFSGTITVNEPGAAIAATITTINMSCANTNDGQALASVASGGVPPFHYNWSRGSPDDPLADSLSPGPISVIITDGNGCTATASDTITGPPTLTISVTAIDDSCYHSKTGSATANVTGGNPPYTYYWSNISSAQTNLGLGVGNYNVVVTDARGCTITGSAIITEPAQLTGDVTPQDIDCLGNMNGSITVTASGGTSPYIYIWNPPTAIGSNPTGLSAGQYHLTLTDAHNCRFVDSTVITEPASLLTASTLHTDVTCYGANNGSMTIVVNGGTAPYYYQGNPLLPGNNLFSNLAPGPHGGDVTDAHGCLVTVLEMISQPNGAQSLLFVATDSICNGGMTGMATAEFMNATGAVTYSWNPGGVLPPERVNLPAGTYEVTATDSNNCSFTASAIIAERAATIMNVDTTNAFCFGGDGRATAIPAGGVPPYTYTWSNSALDTSTVFLPAGSSYSVTVSDVNSCNQTGTFDIGEPGIQILNVTVNDAVCFGGNGRATAIPAIGTPPYTYIWSHSTLDTSTVFLPAGSSYSVTVSDVNSCDQIGTFVINEPPIRILNVTVIHAVCYGGNGTATAIPDGSTPPYTYTWSDSPLDAPEVFLPAGSNYSVTATDANACDQVGSFIIDQPAEIVPVLNTVPAICHNSGDGSAEVTATGGVPGYSFSLSTGATNITGIFNGLSEGNYSMTISDTNGCRVFINDIIITEPDSVVISVLPDPAAVRLGEQLPLFISTNQTGTVEYEWSPETGLSCYDCPEPVFTGLESQSYHLVITNVAGCTGTIDIEVTLMPDEDVYVPNAFSPNGDGENDYWEFYGNLAAAKEVDVKIFNRWGENVFDTNNPHFKWDGIYKGSLVNPDVYIYVAKITWQNKPVSLLKGSLTVLR